MSSALCADASETLGTTGRTVWFDRGDNRGTAGGGDFAPATTRANAPTTNTPPASPSPPASVHQAPPTPSIAASCSNHLKVSLNLTCGVVNLSYSYTLLRRRPGVYRSDSACRPGLWRGRGGAAEAEGQPVLAWRSTGAPAAPATATRMRPTISWPASKSMPELPWVITCPPLRASPQRAPKPTAGSPAPMTGTTAATRAERSITVSGTPDLRSAFAGPAWSRAVPTAPAAVEAAPVTKTRPSSSATPTSGRDRGLPLVHPSRLRSAEPGPAPRRTGPCGPSRGRCSIPRCSPIRQKG